MEGKQREGEQKGVHPSTAPTQEGKSSAQLLRSFTPLKQALAESRREAGLQLPPSPSPAAPAPSAAGTLSPAYPEPATAPACLSQGVPAGLLWSSSPLHSRETEAGALASDPGERRAGPSTSCSTQGSEGREPARSCHCHPP